MQQGASPYPSSRSTSFGSYLEGEAKEQVHFMGTIYMIFIVKSEQSSVTGELENVGRCFLSVEVFYCSLGNNLS